MKSYDFVALGDSFVEPMSPFGYTEHWSYYVKQHLNLSEERSVNYGKSGVGNYYSYLKFLSMMENEEKIDNLVFSFTSTGRFPLINESSEGHAHAYELFSSLDTTDRDRQVYDFTNHDDTQLAANNDVSLKDLFNNWYNGIHQTDLKWFGNQFINLGNRATLPIVVNWCIKKDINAVFLLPFRHENYNYRSMLDPSVYEKFMFIIDINVVSYQEQQVDNKKVDYIKWYHQDDDSRAGHLTLHNNKLLADWICKGLKKQMVGEHNFSLHPALDVSLDNIMRYGEVIKRQT